MNTQAEVLGGTKEHEGPLYSIFVDDLEFHVTESTMTGGADHGSGGRPPKCRRPSSQRGRNPRTGGQPTKSFELKPGSTLQEGAQVQKRLILMVERWKIELKIVESIYGHLEVAPDLAWFIVPSWQLPPGWNKSQVALLLLVPPGYPITPPDNFYVDQDLRLANGAMPGNTSLVTQVGRQWLQFSYHVEGGDWKPSQDPEKGHNLVTFLRGVGQRLREAS